jgi:hypothetical protein
VTTWHSGRTPGSATPPRSFERLLRGPAPDDPRKPRGYLYEALMSVSFRNSYFNLAGERCPSFRTRPTPTTGRLMRDLGLLFRPEEDGFKVLYDTNRTAGLIEFLRRQAPPVWTRLSFILELSTTGFVSFTDVPIGLNPTVSNFFFSNLGPHERRGDAVLLNRGLQVTGAELLPTIPVQYSIGVAAPVERVDVRDLSGEVVMSVPRCVSSGKKLVCRDVLFLDFAHHPEDRYVIQEVGPHGTILGSETVLYTETYPIALCFADLLFTSPDGADEDLFPVRDLFQAQPQVKGVDYILQFGRRALPWRYYVVPRRTPLEQPRIEGPAPFQGPVEVTLPDGAPAFRFTSEGALPLLQESADRFRLSGRLGEHKPSRILIDPLPCAAPAQVLVEETPDGPLPITDMYVYL